MDQEREQLDSLPVRRRRSRPGGRHRDPHAITVPLGTPALVLGVPGAASPDVGNLMSVLGEEVAALAGGSGSSEGGVAVHYGCLDDDRRSLSSIVAGMEASPIPGAPAAVIVPLLTGPRPELDPPLRAAVTAAGAAVTVTESLGPHPLLAGALHARLAEEGLARVDRARMLSVGTSTDGVIVATLGGPAGVEAAEANAVLLASRLAVPVVAAPLDSDEEAAGLQDGAARLRDMGASNPAVAPCLLGPEIETSRLQAAAASIGAPCTAPLGAHPDIAKLVTLRYGTALDEALAAAEAAYDAAP